MEAMPRRARGRMCASACASQPSPPPASLPPARYASPDLAIYSFMIYPTVSAAASVCVQEERAVQGPAKTGRTGLGAERAPPPRTALLFR